MKTCQVEIELFLEGEYVLHYRVKQTCFELSENFALWKHSITHRPSGKAMPTPKNVRMAQLQILCQRAEAIAAQQGRDWTGLIADDVLRDAWRQAWLELFS